MKCTTSELEIETVINRIKNYDINLQPDFQRGEVWILQKKRKLIDSILRGWRIPPIHVVRNQENAIDEVLDGQQRLASIRDFVNGDFAIDGTLPPDDSDIQRRDGLYYSDLSTADKRIFHQYSITIIRLTEYSPAEPAELFYRLNQPVALTSAEQRNAFIGTPRDQIKALVTMFEDLGADKQSIGFSNSRLAYDEVITKLTYTIEIGSITKKIDVSEINNKYRLDIGFPATCVRESEKSIRLFMEAINWQNKVDLDYKLSFNKATLYSWLLFFKKVPIETKQAWLLITSFEKDRNYLKGKLAQSIAEQHVERMEKISSTYPFFEVMINVFNQRSSMASTDASAIVNRDIVIHIYRDILFDNSSQLLLNVIELFNKKSNFITVLDDISDILNWGETL